MISEMCESLWLAGDTDAANQSAAAAIRGKFTFIPYANEFGQWMAHTG